MMPHTEQPHKPTASMMRINDHAVIRRLQPADRLRHDELVAELDQLHHDALPTHIKPPIQARVTEDEFARGLNASGIFLRGYELDGRLMGLIRAVLEEKAEGRAHHASRLVRIDELIVARQARGNRIGTALLQAMQLWAKEVAAQSIELNVYAFNIAAMDFYRTAGFSPRSLIFSRRLE